MARGDSHLLGSDLAAQATPFATLLRPPVAGELAPVTLGGSGRRTRWVTLAISVDRHLADPLFAALPPVLKTGLRGTAPLAWLSDSLGLSLSGSDAPRPGGTAALSRVAELVLIEALRRHVEDLPPGGSGWLAGLNDRYVGAALALVHGRPGEHWTVERLARQVGLSRSALAERFSLVVGEPIFGFLTRVRLQLAAHELATDRALHRDDRGERGLRGGEFLLARLQARLRQAPVGLATQAAAQALGALRSARLQRNGSDTSIR